jgi:hypothetical protein
MGARSVPAPAQFETVVAESCVANSFRPKQTWTSSCRPATERRFLRPSANVGTIRHRAKSCRRGPHRGMVARRSRIGRLSPSCKRRNVRRVRTRDYLPSCLLPETPPVSKCHPGYPPLDPQPRGRGQRSHTFRQATNRETRSRAPALHWRPARRCRLRQTGVETN